MNVNLFQDNESIRQQRNLTNSQKRNVRTTKEGVIVNNFVKDGDLNLNSVKDTFLIPETSSMPEQIYTNQNIVDKKLLPLSGIALGVMGSIALLT